MDRRNIMIGDIKRLIQLPSKIIFRLRHRLLWLIIDPFDLLFNRKHNLTPPYRLRVKVGPFTSAKKYSAVAYEFLSYLKSICNLSTNENVLDVGCGCGQIASTLTSYLKKTVIYEGFDIDEGMIKWCQENISSRYANFHFIKLDIQNQIFNPNGKFLASQYRFPYKNESFDLVIVKSVFMHMLPADMENYLSEIYRVLKTGGRCLVSYFLINTESLGLIDSGNSTIDFRCIFKTFRIKDNVVPERAIAYDEEYIRSIVEKKGLRISGKIYYGSWPGRKEFLSYQDIILLSK